MCPATKEIAEQLKNDTHEILGESASELFLRRVDAILDECSAGKLTVAQTCEKVQKLVPLFIDEGKAREIGTRCSSIITKNSVAVA